MLSLARSGHLCFWEESSFDLDWETTSLLEEAARADCALLLDESTLVLGEPRQPSLCFVRLSSGGASSSLEGETGDTC